MASINITQTRHHISIAYEQAAISSDKSQRHKAQGNDYASEIYKVRAAALRAYAQSLKDKMKKAERKTFKKVQN